MKSPSLKSLNLISYDIENLKDPEKRESYTGETKMDYYGREVPKHAHGTARLEFRTSSSSEISDGVIALFDRIIDRTLLIRRVNLTAINVEEEGTIHNDSIQLDLFTDYEAQKKDEEERDERIRKERSVQEATLGIKKAFGKNAILKGTNLEEGATAKERNMQIGGHKA